MKDLMQFVDADAAAYSEYMLAMKLPKDTEEEQMIRELAMQEGIQTAIQVPVTVSRIANQLWPTLKELSTVCNINCKSDLQVGVRMLETAVWGTYYNVTTNLSDLKDQEFKTQVQEEISAAVKYAQEECAAILKVLQDRKE